MNVELGACSNAPKKAYETRLHRSMFDNFSVVRILVLLSLLDQTSAAHQQQRSIMIFEAGS